MSPAIESAAAAIRRQGIIAIVRGNFPVARLLEIGETLLDSSVGVLEVTLNSAGALEAITALQGALGDRLLVGAGTVRSAAQVDSAVDAGARFVVAPNLDPEAVARALDRATLPIPGVFTATEAHNARAAGCRLVKLFPADAVGPAYLRALRAPLDDIDFIPTGGIGAANAADYARAGAVAIGVGGALVAGPEQPMGDLAARAAALRRAWESAARER